MTPLPACLPACLPAYTEAGQGDTAVLLLHGIGGGQAIWAAALPVLASAGYHAVALDFPGYAAPLNTSTGTPTLDAMVQAVRTLLAHIGARRNVLVGHSMGGMVAQEVVARSPGGIDALVLACTSAAFGKSDGAWQARFVAERLAPLDAGLGMAGVAHKLVPTMVAPGADAAAQAFAVQVMSQVPQATYRSALQAIAAFDRRANLAHIKVPTLCLAAAHDRTAPPDVMQRMAQRIPGAEYQCLPNAGHIANVEQPAAFHAAVLSFLQRRLA